MKKLFAPYLVLICVLLLAGCAQMAEPTGGDRDEAAPEIITERTQPRNGTVNFTEDRISIGFSEYITVKNQQVVITPALAQKPVIKNKGKRVEIIFEEPLAANTTYTVNLSGAISDIHEGKTVENLQYVFSTGPVLDSLGISGKVINAFSETGVSSSTVILQPADNDTAIFKSKPAYFLKSSKDGTFRFFHLKQGAYRIYAINDLNTDLLYSQFPEDIAFMDTVIVLDSNVSKLVLRQFKPEEKKTYLQRSANVSKYVQVFRFNKQIPQLNVRPLKAADTTLKFYTAQATDSVFYMSLHDTLRKDTLRFQVRSGEKVLDTLAFTAHLGRNTSGKASFRLKAGAETFPVDSIFIASNTGCIVNAEKIILTDTLHKKPVAFKVKTVFNGCSIFPQWPTEKIPLKIVCLPGAFTSPITRQVNDTIKGMTTLLPPEKTGNIKLSLKGLEEKGIRAPVCVIMMENLRVKKFRVDAANPVINAELLKPGNYSFFLFDDADGNGEWSPGNFDEKIQPENIWRYAQPIKVKANWDQDLTWIL